MYILGINAYHGDVSAALVQDGELVAAVEEERFRRVKHWAGFPTQAIRTCLAMAGIAGACFPLLLTPQWAERMTAGRGWIAVALVVFASWKPFRLLAGAYLFGLVMTMELYAKAGGGVLSVIPSELWAALPYLATVVVLVLISLRRDASTNAPACLGKPFLPAN